jgi:gamma-glutamyltranspeptidase/glutathione hydrolase
MTRRAAAVANDPVVEEAASDFLMAGGSAIGAVLCGFFAASGAYAGVLLGPITLLVGGVGAGARAFDGRMRQPGRGSKRPRGITESDEVPEVARLAVPASVPAALVAHAYDGSQSLAKVLKPGISRAQRAGAEGRSELLRLVRTSGAGAFSDVTFVRPLLRTAGPSQGGLISSADFGAPGDLDHEAVTRETKEGTLLEAPWAAEGAEVDISELGVGCAILAVDVRGTFAALSYRRLVDGFPLDDLELEAPLCAVPVRRGVSRVSPGTPLPAPAPVALVVDGAGTVVEAVAAPTVLRLSSVADATLRLTRSQQTKAVQTARA